MYNFDEFDADDIKALLNELDTTPINKVPEKGTRAWYLMAFCHWLLTEILEGNNPLLDNITI